MKIMKFGGAVLRNSHGFSQMLNIIKENLDDAPLLIIISAFSKATKMFEKAALIAEQGELKKANHILHSIIEEHEVYSENILSDQENKKRLKELLLNSSIRIKEFFKGISITRELTPRTLDAILSYGEFFALHIINYYLKENDLNPFCIDSTSLIISDSNYGKARPVIPETQKKINQLLMPALAENHIVVTQGFVAKNVNNDITTMGLESSNLTAVLLAELLNQKELLIWTDVPGFRIADPKICPDTKLLSNLSYNFAYASAVSGLKLIYPEMIAHAERKNIKLIYRSAFEPERGETVISSKRNLSYLPLIIIKENLSLVHMFINSFQESHIAEDFIRTHENQFFNYSVYKDSVSFIADTKETQNMFIPAALDTTITHNLCLITIFNFIPKYDYLINSLTEISKEKIIKLEINHYDDSIRLIISAEDAQAMIKELHRLLVVAD